MGAGDGGDEYGRCSRFLGASRKKTPATLAGHVSLFPGLGTVGTWDQAHNRCSVS